MLFKSYLGLRLWSMFKKELIVIMRDYRTYIFVLITPFIQAILFGIIIDNDARNLPTVVVTQDNSPFAQAIIQSFKNTNYFNIKQVMSEQQVAEELMRKGEIKFILHIPATFSHDLLRNNNPHLLLEGDATNPVAVNNAFHAAKNLNAYSLEALTKGTLSYLEARESSYTLDAHAKYNPSLKSQYYTLPGLLSAILTISLSMVMAISITGEYETGTMEMLLITPIRPFEVIIGKLLPNIFLGYILFFAILIVGIILFSIPFYGSALLLVSITLPYIIANIALGLAISCIARTQFQAAQIAGAYAMPAILFSGFLFPRESMPNWAQWMSDLYPTTYFLRICSAIMLKGATLNEILPDALPIIGFAIFFLGLTYTFYRKTLD